MLVERLPSWSANPFSSAGLPTEALAQHRIPPDAVAASWKGLDIHSSAERASWTGTQPLGVVLDFGRLRALLAQEAATHGAQVCLGTRALAWGPQDGGAWVDLRDAHGTRRVEARLVVDATGPSRALMRPHTPEGIEYLMGAGLELVVEVDSAQYDRFAHRLVFYLGNRWMPQGYGWIFPMEPGRLKVGMGRASQDHAESRGLRERVDRLLRQELGLTDPKVLDIHGGVLRYARGMKDTLVVGPALAIGDAASTLNILGGEGIRHAMRSAELAVPFLQLALSRGPQALRGYPAALHRTFRRSWRQCEALAVQKYLLDNDTRLDALVRFLKQQDLSLVMEALFHYRFSRLIWRLGPAYVLRRTLRKLRGSLPF